MKLKLALVILLCIQIFSQKLSAVSDTAWTKTLPNKAIIGKCFFSEDDSLLIAKIAEPDSSYIGFFNSYTGELKRSIKINYQIGWAQLMNISYKDTLLVTYSRTSTDTIGGTKEEFNIKFINYKTGQVVDSILPGNDPDLNPDTSDVTQLEFTPDGTKLYGFVNIIDSYDIIGNPIYREKLFVWDVATGQLIRKIRTNFELNRTFRIAPNNKYYVLNNKEVGGCVNFWSLNTDSLLYWICPGDSLYGGNFIFPKDTTHIMVMYNTKFKIFNLSDFSVEKEIKNDTVIRGFSNFAKGINYIVCTDENYSTSIYNISQNLITYKYSPFNPTGTGFGSGVLVSNNSELIFRYCAYKLIMYNAKYETTSVKEPDGEEPKLIYPNPTSDYIDVSVGANGRSPLQSDVRIYNVLGEIQTTPNPTPALTV